MKKNDLKDKMKFKQNMIMADGTEQEYEFTFHPIPRGAKYIEAFGAVKKAYDSNDVSQFVAVIAKYIQYFGGLESGIAPGFEGNATETVIEFFRNDPAAIGLVMLGFMTSNFPIINR